MATAVIGIHKETWARVLLMTQVPKLLAQTQPTPYENVLYWRLEEVAWASPAYAEVKELYTLFDLMSTFPEVNGATDLIHPFGVRVVDDEGEVVIGCPSDYDIYTEQRIYCPIDE